jgi:hypothetical protein
VPTLPNQSECRLSIKLLLRGRADDTKGSGIDVGGGCADCVGRLLFKYICQGTCVVCDWLGQLSESGTGFEVSSALCGTTSAVEYNLVDYLDDKVKEVYLKRTGHIAILLNIKSLWLNINVSTFCI